jgi:hypothetical protein
MMRNVALAELPTWLRELHAIWDAKRTDRPYPARTDFRFEEMWGWMGRMHLIEILDGDFRFSVFGTRPASLIDHEYTGKKISEIRDPIARIWEAGYRQAVAGRVPVFGHHPPGLYGTEQLEVSWWRAILPIGAGDRLTHLLVGIQIVDSQGRYL